MIRRRRFVEGAAWGMLAAWMGPAFGLAQDPKPKSRAKARGKAAPKAADTPPLVADEQVNRILGQARTDGRRLPGMIGAVVRGEEVEAIGAVGIRRIGSADPIRIDDAVHLGSNTKAMTATMLGTLVDEGKIRWESSVREVFPELVGRVHPDYLPVTLHQLLGHRAGFPHDVSWGSLNDGRPVTDQRRALMMTEMQQPPLTRPGSTYAYSNVGFVLAGLMAEKVGRAPWEDLMKRRIFDPLGMTSAGFGPPGLRGRPDHAWGHRAEGNVVEAVHEDNPASMGPAGTVHCSIPDYARFASLHLRGSFKGVQIVKPETLRALHTPGPGEDYAGGWSVGERSWAGGRVLNHNGSNTLWYCTIWLAPVRDLALIVATNAGGKPAENACDQAVQGLTRYTSTDARGPRRR